MLVVLPACGAIGFDVQAPIPEQSIQGNPLGGILPSFLPSPFRLNIDVRAETQKRNTGPATAAFLNELRFDATQNSGTFDFIDELHIFIASPQNSSLQKQEIARLVPVPDGKTSITLEVVPGVDLLPYINSGAEISATATGTQPTRTFTFSDAVTITIRI
jgi:hypothetical protein